MKSTYLSWLTINLQTVVHRIEKFMAKLPEILIDLSGKPLIYFFFSIKEKLDLGRLKCYCPFISVSDCIII